MKTKQHRKKIKRRKERDVLPTRRMIEPADRCCARNVETVISPTVMFMRFFPVLKAYGKKFCSAITMSHWLKHYIRRVESHYGRVDSLSPTIETVLSRLQNRSAGVSSKIRLRSYGR